VYADYKRNLFSNHRPNQVGIIPILGCELGFFEADDLETLVALRTTTAEFARVVSPLLPLFFARDPEETLRRELDPASLAFLRHVRFVDPDRALRLREAVEIPDGETERASRSVTKEIVSIKVRIFIERKYYIGYSSQPPLLTGPGGNGWENFGRTDFVHRPLDLYQSAH
jgi:hypothetical protein